MDYEKAYKESLGRAIAQQETYLHLGNVSAAKAIENIFHELRESEDERIRKDIISHLQHECAVNRYVSDVEYDRWIAWLEKQGEQKHVEQDTEINDLWVYIREWNDKFGRLPKDEDELAACIDYVIKRQKPAS